MKKITMIAKITALACLLTGLATVPAPAQTTLVPSFRVDGGGAAYTGHTTIQSLGNNRFVVVWADYRTGETKIYASIYDNNGAVIRDDYKIDDGIVGSVSSYTGPGGIKIDSNGNFFVTYLYSPDLVNIYGRIRKFYPNGDPAGPSVNIKPSGTTPSQVIQVAHGANDKVIISYLDGPTPGYVYFQFFDNNLNMLGSRVIASQSVPGSKIALASDATGNFVLTWRQSDSPGDGKMRARLYDPDGNPRTNEFPIEPSMSGGDNPVAVYNNQGNFIVVWWAALTWGEGRVFDGAGNPLTGVIDFGPAMPDTNANFWQPPSVDADDAGNFIVVYPYRDDSTPQDIYGTILGPTGQILNQFFRIGTRGASYDVDVAATNPGQFVVAWRDQLDDTNGDIYATILANDRWSPLDPLETPAAGPVALAILAGLLGWAMRRRLKRNPAL